MSLKWFVSGVQSHISDSLGLGQSASVAYIFRIGKSLINSGNPSLKFLDKGLCYTKNA